MHVKCSVVKVIIISLNYYPEDTAIGLYSTQMAEYLVLKKNKVTVITGFPYYPQWKIARAYKHKKRFYKERFNGVNIMRYKQFVPATQSFAKRIVQIVDFTLGSFINSKKITEADIVISIIPFTSAAWLGNLLANRINAKHWIHIQDFEFDAALETGVTSIGFITKLVSRLLTRIESSILNAATIVSTISFAMLEKLKTKTTSEQYYFPNWVDETVINPDEANEHSLLNSNKFKVLYAGNIGAKQDWAFFNRVVNEFKDSSNIEFIIVGDGAMKSEIETATIKNENVSYHKPVPYDELNNLLCSADLHILFQKNTVIDTVMPSKILGMMASQKPSLVTGNINSEVAKVFEKSNGGIFLDSTNFKGVIAIIKKLSKAPSAGVITGQNARDYVISKFSKKYILDNLALRLASFRQID